MMPPGGVRRIGRRLIHQTARKVQPQKSISAILYRFANGKWGVAKSKWPIRLPAHPLEKSEPQFVSTSSRRS